MSYARDLVGTPWASARETSDLPRPLAPAATAVEHTPVQWPMQPTFGRLHLAFHLLDLGLLLPSTDTDKLPCGAQPPTRHCSRRPPPHNRRCSGRNTAVSPRARVIDHGL